MLLIVALIIFGVVAFLLRKKPIRKFARVSGKIRYTDPPANVTVKMNYNKIIPYWVYGAKFDENCDDAVFTERFSDGMVPMMFLSKNAVTDSYDVAVLDKEFVPERLLRVGAEFTLEDNGKFFCRGVINTVVEEQEQ